MISTTMATALNEQIKWEMYSANLYLAMSAYLQDAGLTGFSHLDAHSISGRNRSCAEIL